MNEIRSNRTPFLANPAAKGPAVARPTVAAPTPTPTGNGYRDIFNFLPTAQASSDIMTNEAVGTANRGHGTYINPNDIDLNNLNTQSPEIQQLIQSGAIRSTAGMYNTEEGGAGDMGYIIDYDKFPMVETPTGQKLPASYFTPTNEAGSNLINPRMQFNDQNYGRVSASQNNRGYIRDIWDMLYNIVPSLFIAGTTGMVGNAGLLTGAGRSMLQVPRAAQALANGGDPTQMVANLAMNYFHVPTALRPFLQYGLGTLNNRGRGGGGG